MVSTIPCNLPSTSILSPGWNLFSAIIRIPDIRFLNKSWAPNATATENSPNPAIIGPISTPKISKIIANDLKKEQIYCAGIDFSDQKLNGDINVTSPTGLKTLFDISKINLAKTFWKYLKAWKI